MKWQLIVINTACTKTVTGKYWFHNYVKCLGDTRLNKVKISQSEKSNIDN